MEVQVAFEERYWYPDDGSSVWIAGYQLVDPVTGSYLARDPRHGLTMLLAPAATIELRQV